MSELLAILSAAALFVGFAWLERSGARRDCGSCAHRESESCDACPLAPKESR